MTRVCVCMSICKNASNNIHDWLYINSTAATHDCKDLACALWQVSWAVALEFSCFGHVCPRGKLKWQCSTVRGRWSYPNLNPSPNPATAPLPLAYRNLSTCDCWKLPEPSCTCGSCSVVAVSFYDGNMNMDKGAEEGSPTSLVHCTYGTYSTLSLAPRQSVHVVCVLRMTPALSCGLCISRKQNQHQQVGGENEKKALAKVAGATEPQNLLVVV